MADRTEEIRAGLMKARQRAWVAKLDHAIELLWKAESMDPVARAVLEDLRADMSLGTSWGYPRSVPSQSGSKE